MKKKVSIIIPFFNEKENIPIILSELELVIIKLKESYDFEILLMDNGLMMDPPILQKKS